MTIEGMAKELGLSKSTVSRALSGKGRISEATREKVCTYAKEHNFEPLNSLRQSKAKTRNIGVVIPSDAYLVSIPFFQECLLGICEAATHYDFNILVTTGTENDISSIQGLLEKKVIDGIVLTRSLEDDKAVKYLTDIDFPLGMTGTCDNIKVIQVDGDNKGSAEELISMLIGKGYRRFALVIGNISYKVNKERYKGFCQGLSKHGIPEEEQLLYTDFRNLDIVDNLISGIMSKKAECIICGDDVICTIVMAKLQAEGYKIPDDISVASLYNSLNLNCFLPAITTVSISAKEIGNVIGTQLINYLVGNEYRQKITVDYEILFRKSTITTLHR